MIIDPIGKRPTCPTDFDLCLLGYVSDCFWQGRGAALREPFVTPSTPIS